ncbi:hypothetical protein AgCh_033604 [Apium graveolens]
MKLADDTWKALVGKRTTGGVGMFGRIFPSTPCLFDHTSGLIEFLTARRSCDVNMVDFWAHIAFSGELGGSVNGCRCRSRRGGEETVIVPVDSGETNLLRVVNSALNQQLFFAIANHKMTVVGANASYVKPFTTNTLMLGPGQTTDVLINADQTPSRYYIAARAYASAQNAPFDNTTTTAILEYKSAPCPAKETSIKPVLPSLPAFNDTATATRFSTSFRSPRKVEVPTDIYESLFFTVGLGLNRCPSGANANTCQAPNRTRFTASMNNVSFVLPSNFSLLQAHHQEIPGVFTTDFPAAPPVKFDYTSNVSRWLKYGSNVQVVLQGTSIFTAENHHIHLHGYDFYIIAEGFGNFNPKTDTSKFNLVDPPLRNTVSLPVSGWAVIRFVADNPGVWIMHCHLEVHITWGLAILLLTMELGN